MFVDDAEPRAGFNSKLQVEAQTVLKQAVFQRSPVLSKLLCYLVEETAAGRADNLKSFIVAIECLGRSENFDAASDSSARVQMVRLRKTLESHYAKHGPVDELCIYLQPGSYKIRLGKLSVAYPMLYRPLSDTENQPGHAAAALEVPLVPTRDDNELSPAEPLLKIAVNPVNRKNWLVGVGALVGIAIAASFWFLWQGFAPAKFSTTSPILELLPVDSANTPELAQTSRIVSSAFADDLPRFKLSRVRVINDRGDLRQPDEQEHVYRLSSRLEKGAEGNQMLFLNLIDAQTNTSLWSREVALPEGGQTVNALIPLLAEINGPFGIIATHGSMIYKDSKSGGYPCLLKYFEFVKTRERNIENEVATCLGKPVTEQRMAATMLASRAFFAIERRSAMGDFAAASKQGIGFARAAVAADPNDGSANFALARMSYFENDCMSARFYTGRALETNPNSPMITATLAALANVCDYPDAARLLDLAFLAQSPRYAKGRLLLALAALAQNRPDKIAEIKDSDLPQTQYNRVSFYLAESLIAASENRRKDAARNWVLFSRSRPSGSLSPDEKLRDIVVLPAMRRQVIVHLENGGAFGE
jgi:hypothetical protein